MEDSEGRRVFSLEVVGRTCRISFKPRYYQIHRNLPFFEPWNYQVWPDSVAGWCSWWPYRRGISEDVVTEVADLFATRLRDFGYDTIQIDDGFQAGSGGLPADWLNTNERFPGGLDGLARIIRDRGLKPGIWVNVHFGDEAFVKAHPQWFAQDPDHVDITPEGEEIIRPVLICMSGAVMMLTDRVKIYRDDAKIEGARRCAPVPFSLPGQIYDYDPVKTDNIVAGLRNTEGGGPPGPIDADQRGTFCPWWLLEIHRRFESWNVLARLGWKAQPAVDVPFGALGLAADREYLVYEFWGDRYVGAFRGCFPAPAQAPQEARVYAVRAKEDFPQILSTSRHIAQGWPDLQHVRWNDRKACLTGASRVIGEDPYRLTLCVPAVPRPFSVKQALIDGKPVQPELDCEVCRLAYVPAETGVVAWEVWFERE